MELRQTQRYRLAAQVNFTGEQENGITEKREGLTRDISKVGLFVFAPSPPPENSVVFLEVTLPVSSSADSGTRLRSHGHVVRTELGGFAVSADVAFRLQSEKHSSAAKAEAAKSGPARHTAGSASKTKYASHLQ